MRRLSGRLCGRLGATLALLAAAALVVGLSGALAGAPKTVRVLYPAGLDMEKGAVLAGWDLFLKDIKVEPVILRGQPTVARAILSGKEHVAYQAFSFFAQTVAKGGDMVALAVSEQRLVWGLIAKKDIRSLADLRGKRVAAHAPAGISASIVDFYAARAGMTRKDLQVLYIRGGENRIAALVAGRIDATPAAPIDAYEALKTGKFHVLAMFSEDAPEVVGPMLVASSKFIRENPKVVQKLVTAAVRGMRLAYEEPKRFAAAVKARAPYDNEELFWQGHRDFVKAGLWAKNGGDPLLGTLQRSADWFVKNSPADAKKMGIVGLKFTSKHVNATFLENALKQLGRR